MAVDGIVGEAWVMVRPYTREFGATLKKEVGAQVASTDAQLAASGGLVGKKAVAATGRSAEEAGVLAGSRFSRSFAKVGHSATHGLMGALVGGAAIAEVGASALNAVKQQTTAVAQMEANTGETLAQAQELGNAFLDTARKGESTFKSPEITGAFATVAGQLKLTEGHVLSTASSLRFMAAAEHDAEATGGDLASTTSALASTMQAFHIPLQGVNHEADMLFNVSRALNVPIEQVSTSVNRLHTRLGVAAPSLRDTGGLMLAFGKSGIQGSRGLMLVSSSMSSLLAAGQKAGAGTKKSALAIEQARISEQTATDAVIKAQHDYGKTSEQYVLAVEKQHVAQEKLAAAQETTGAKLTKGQQVVKDLGLQVYDAQGKFVGFRSIIEQLQPKLAKMSDAQRTAALQTLFGKSSAQVMGSVLKAGLPGWEAATAAVNKHGTAQAAAAEKSKSLEGKTKTLGAEMNALETDLGSKMVPELSAVVGWLGANQWAAKGLAGVIGGVLLLAVGRYVGGLVVGSAQAVAALGRQVAGWVGLQATSTEAAAVTEVNEAKLAAIYGVTADEIQADNAAVAASSGAMAGEVAASNETMAASSISSMGMMKGAVLGVAAAIGAFTLGKATAGHGAGGAGVATLGGAVMGAVAGFSVGGPFGAAVGAAGGALVGLIGHFHATSKEIDGTTKAIEGYTKELATALKLDLKHPGASTRQFLETYLQKNTGATSQFAKYGLTEKDIQKFLKTGSAPTGTIAKLNAAAQGGFSDGGVVEDKGAVEAMKQLDELRQAWLNASGQAKAYAAVVDGVKKSHDADSQSVQKEKSAVDGLNSSLAKIPRDVHVNLTLEYGAAFAGKLESSRLAKLLRLQGRAGGGPTVAGQSYLVGEHEPEILTMGAQGGYVHAGVFAARGGTGDLSAAYLHQISALLSELVAVERDQPGALARQIHRPGTPTLLASAATRSMHE